MEHRLGPQDDEGDRRCYLAGVSWAWSQQAQLEVGAATEATVYFGSFGAVDRLGLTVELATPSPRLAGLIWAETDLSGDRVEPCDDGLIGGKKANSDADEEGE